jgi:rhodanese-related sulfurtransferase
MEGLEAGRPVVIYGKTANRSEVARLMLQARGSEAHVMEGGSEAWSPRACPSPPPTASPAASPDPPTSW